MTDDIVARLRDLNPWRDLDWPEVVREAADEIENGDRLILDLRHERNVLQKICAERDGEIMRLNMMLTTLRTQLDENDYEYRATMEMFSD